jgi:hypothetical protein
MPWKWPTKGRFVKGQRPKHWRPVDSERRTDKGIFVKICEPNKWRRKHMVVWEAANGPLPKGSWLVFLDGDRFNCALDNLRLRQRVQTRWRRKKPVSEEFLSHQKSLNEIYGVYSGLRSALAARLAASLGFGLQGRQEGV